MTSVDSPSGSLSSRATRLSTGRPSGEGAAAAPWVVFRLAAQRYALPVQHVREMVTLPAVRPLPTAPPYVRGLITLRGHAMPLVDLRSRLGLPSLRQARRDLLELLSIREEDHLMWLETLDDAVRGETAFHLPVDPDACAFGRWLRDFRTDDVLLATVLRRLDEPHRAVHAGGAEALRLAERSDREAAIAQLEDVRNGALEKLTVLLHRARDQVRGLEREIALVLSAEGLQPTALAADTVEEVVPLTPVEEQDTDALLAGLGNGLNLNLARRQEDGAVVVLLDARQLAGHNGNGSAG